MLGENSDKQRNLFVCIFEGKKEGIGYPYCMKYYWSLISYGAVYPNGIFKYRLSFKPSIFIADTLNQISGPISNLTVRIDNQRTQSYFKA